LSYSSDLFTARSIVGVINRYPQAHLTREILPLPIGGYKATMAIKPKVKFEPSALTGSAWCVQVTLPHGERINLGHFDAESEATNWIAAHSAKWIKKYRGGRYARVPLTRQSSRDDKVASDVAPSARMTGSAKESTAPYPAREVLQRTSQRQSGGKSEGPSQAPSRPNPVGRS